jgi:hypothetical protein
MLMLVLVARRSMMVGTGRRAAIRWTTRAVTPSRVRCGDARPSTRGKLARRTPCLAPARLTVVSSLITGWLEFCETEALGEGGKEVETFADRLPARRSVPFDVSSDGGDGEQDVVVGGVGG